MSIGFADFAAILFGFIRVRCVSVRSFLLRNWCGYPLDREVSATSKPNWRRIAIAVLYIIWYMDII